MKRCSKCKTITTELEFRVADTICTPCRNAYALANKDKALARNRKYQAKQKQKRMWKVVPKATQLKIRNYAINYATKWGFPNLADELAQDIIEAKARGTNRSNAQVWTDLLRNQFGRGKKGEQTPNIDKYWVGYENVVLSSEATQDGTSAYVLKCLNDLYPDNLSLPRISFMLHVVHGLTLLEVAQLFFRTEGRICKVVIEVREALSKNLQE